MAWHGMVWSGSAPSESMQQRLCFHPSSPLIRDGGRLDALGIGLWCVPSRWLKQDEGPAPGPWARTPLLYHLLCSAWALSLPIFACRSLVANGRSRSHETFLLIGPHGSVSAALRKLNAAHEDGPRPPPTRAPLSVVTWQPNSASRWHNLRERGLDV
jgi:hypothetical protein